MEYPDYHAEAAWKETTVEGKMKTKARRTLACFAEHPEDLSSEDAHKAVEIALCHAERFEQLFEAKNTVLFGAINPKTGVNTAATRILSRMKERHFAAIWGVK